MRCDQNHSMIEAYFDGELEDDARLKMSRHLEECASCASVFQELKTEGDVYLGYEPQVEVRPELWANVQSRIAADRLEIPSGALTGLSSWFRNTFAMPQVSGWATAALVLIAIGLTVTVMKYVRPSAENAPTQVAQSSKEILPAQTENVAKPETKDADKPKAEDVNPVQKAEFTAAVGRPKAPVNVSKPRLRQNSPDQLVREAEQKYLTAIAMLTRTVERNRSRMDPTTLARLEQSLRVVDRSIADTRKVVRQHPADPVAVQYMLNAYSRKVDVLRETIGH